MSLTKSLRQKYNFMEKLCIIGAGISGLSIARMLNSKYDVTVIEKESIPGGLIKCKHVNGSLFHTCGGHVFNSKRHDVLDWFWRIFNRDAEFSKTDRNACVFLNTPPNVVPYPIENHVYYFDENIQKCFYDDLQEIDAVKGINTRFEDYNSFGDFLRWRFGKTLYELYFEPYNKKVWRRDLFTVPMSWMEGKLPMPTTDEMRVNNAFKIKEQSFVHSSFWYEKNNGSQYIADRLAEDLNIIYEIEIKSVKKSENKWLVNGWYFDKVIFCGNIKDMINILEGVDVEKFKSQVDSLEYHGTTSVFCEIDANPYSWIYQPSTDHESHRIICTGNFSKNNNGDTVPKGRITATIEFTDYISKDDIMDNLKRIPMNPVYLDHKYNKYSYPIQNAHTREMINILKKQLSTNGFYFTGRFADWEYYNMDAAIGAAMDLVKKYL